VPSCRWILNHPHIFISNLDKGDPKTDVSSVIDTSRTTLVKYPDHDVFLICQVSFCQLILGITSLILTVMSMIMYYRSNLKVQDDCAERPDISGMALANSQFKNIVCVCEVKGEDWTKDRHATLCDLIRIECFSKDAIDTCSNYGVLGILGIHVVGKYLVQDKTNGLVD
jgi:hypothetical protein